MIQEKIPSNFLLKLLRKAGHDVNEISSTRSVSGGSINESYQIQTDAGAYFVKRNSASRYPGMFDAEKKGLETLSHARAIRIPQVIATGEENGEAYLLMQYIQEGGKSSDTWRDFGTQLAALHRETADTFGLGHDNYIGSLPQANAEKTTWAEFFATQRIEPQLKMAESYFSSSERRQFERLLSQLEKLVPVEKPALVHGDLWSGNYLIDAKGNPVLIDPAVYYGHREMDLAMMHLFGGFSPDIFDHYHENFPLERNWRERIDLHNLYPLLVHVNLFGGGYVGQVRSVLKRFG